MIKYVFSLVVMFYFLNTHGQVDPVQNDYYRFNRPTTSLRAEVSQKIGLNYIRVNYGRPNVKGRKIFDGLLQYGKIWRLGADYATILDLQNEYIIANDTVSKGKYALYAIPHKDHWQIILNKDTEGWGQYTYDNTLNAYEFRAPLEKAPEFTETLTIGFMNTSLNHGEIYFQWENIRTILPIKVSIKHKEMIERDINIALGLDTVNVAYKYYLASEYYFLEKKDYPKALEYIRKAIEGDIKWFYSYFLEGEILAAMGKYKEAVEAAKKGLGPSKENNPEWHWKLNKAIKEWGEKK